MDAVFPRAFASRQNIEIEETIRKERPRLLNFIRTRVRTEDDAQDILQEVFGQLIEAYRGLDTIDRVSSWLFRVARNKITDAYRRRKPEAGAADVGRARARIGNGARRRGSDPHRGPRGALHERDDLARDRSCAGRAASRTA